MTDKVSKTNKLKLDKIYDDGMTSYILKDNTVQEDIMSELLRIDIYDGNFKQGSEDTYHNAVMKFIIDLIKKGSGWND